MKKLTLLLLSLGILVSSSAMANSGTSFNTCYAQTYCPRVCMGPYGPYQCGSYPIFCKTWAEARGTGAATACTFEFVLGSHVRCTGVNSYGMWEDIYVTCQ